MFCGTFESTCIKGTEQKTLPPHVLSYPAISVMFGSDMAPFEVGRRM